MTSTCIVCHGMDIREVELNNLSLRRCVACGLYWRRTFDISLSHYEHADPGTTDERRAARMRNARDRIVTMFRSIPRTHVCDVGTGEGTFLEVLAELGGAGVGIEPGVRYCAEARLHGVRIVGSTVEDVGRVIVQESIRTLTLFHVIEHLPRPRQVLENLFTELPPGGYLVVETPNMESPVLKAQNYQDRLIYPEHLYYFSEHNMRALLEQIGFSVCSSGRRDFDQYHRPIRDSLWRLTFWKRLKPSSTKNSEQLSDEAAPLLHSVPQESRVTFRSLVRALLARIVVVSGRLNYMWFVVQKPL